MLPYDHMRAWRITETRWIMPFKVDAPHTSFASKVLDALKILGPETGRCRATCFSELTRRDRRLYTRLPKERMVIWLRGSRGRTPWSSSAIPIAVS